METVTLSLSDFENRISNSEKVTVDKIFKDKETVDIPISTAALNSSGEFEISDELFRNMDIRTDGKWGLPFDYIIGSNQPDYPERDYSTDYFNLHLISRTNTTLIEEIKNIGVERSIKEYYSRIYFRKVPFKLLPFIAFKIDDEGEVEYNSQDAMRMLMHDANIEVNDLIKRMIELDFLGIVFKILARNQYK